MNHKQAMGSLVKCMQLLSTIDVLHYVELSYSASDDEAEHIASLLRSARTQWVLHIDAEQFERTDVLTALEQWAASVNECSTVHSELVNAMCWAYSARVVTAPYCNDVVHMLGSMDAEKLLSMLGQAARTVLIQRGFQCTSTLEALGAPREHQLHVFGLDDAKFDEAAQRIADAVEAKFGTSQSNVADALERGGTYGFEHALTDVEMRVSERNAQRMADALYGLDADTRSALIREVASMDADTLESTWGEAYDAVSSMDADVLDADNPFHALIQYVDKRAAAGDHEALETLHELFCTLHADAFHDALLDALYVDHEAGC